MKSANPDQPPNDHHIFQIVGLNYVSLYIEVFIAAIGFYERVFGPAENVDEEGQIYGWWMGSTWLAVFPSKAGTHEGSNPRNVEFAIQVSTPEEVDVLHRALLTAGAKNCWSPEDTTMYEEMRFSCVDDPFGVRIDIYCPIEESAS